MSNFRENYLIARDEIAKELIQKYNLVESYKDDERLTLDNSKYSIHLTFYVPDGDNVSVSERGKEPGYGHSFMSLLCQKYPDRNRMIEILKKLFSDIDQNDYTYQAIIRKIGRKIEFIENKFPEYFK